MPAMTVERMEQTNRKTAWDIRSHREVAEISQGRFFSHFWRSGGSNWRGSFVIVGLKSVGTQRSTLPR